MSRAAGYGKPRREIGPVCCLRFCEGLLRHYDLDPQRDTPP
ncbi:MAG: hypothetical protein ACKVS9_19855 [Phycisphaerae bacterium]